MQTFKARIIAVVVFVTIVLLAAAVASNSATPKVTKAAEVGQAQFVDLGEVNSVNVTKMVEGDHVCYIVSSAKWNNVGAAINCPK